MKPTIADRLNFDLKEIKNFDWLIGMDEVGWGCIAGDLVIGAVAVHKSLLQNFSPQDDVLNKIRDSKKLSAKIRQEITQALPKEKLETKLITAIGQSSVDYINTHGLAVAYDEALSQIITALGNQIDLSKALLLLDGSRVPGFLKTHAINKNIVVKGDDASFSIGLASIIAKEYRDDLMTKLHDLHPQYHFDNHKGYGTAEHIKALKEHGISPMHRLKGTTTILS
jgi:ribonuclease HII